MIFIVGERRQGVMTPGGGLNRDKHLSQSGVLMTHSPSEKRAQPLVGTLASPTQPGPALLALLIPGPAPLPRGVEAADGVGTSDSDSRRWQVSGF